MINLLSEMTVELCKLSKDNCNCDNSFLKTFYLKAESMLAELLANAECSLQSIYSYDAECNKDVNVNIAVALAKNVPEHLKDFTNKSVEEVIEYISDNYGADNESAFKSVLTKLIGHIETDYTENVCAVANILSENIHYCMNAAYEVFKKYVRLTKDEDTCKAYKMSMCYIMCFAIASSKVLDKIKCNLTPTTCSQNEAAQLNNEDVDNYVTELNKLIPELREFYDTFKYKNLVTPRYKKINKMREYMLGALNRKYTLKIPMYKVINATDDAKEIIETKFIKKLEDITNKYPNYKLLTPNFGENTDMFIYVTLKEPFGEEGDRTDRKMQSVQDKNPSDDENMLNEKKSLHEDAGNVKNIATISAFGLVSLFAAGALAKDSIDKHKKESTMSPLSSYGCNYCINKLKPLLQLLENTDRVRYPMRHNSTTWFLKMCKTYTQTYEDMWKEIDKIDRKLITLNSYDEFKANENALINAYSKVYMEAEAKCAKLDKMLEDDPNEHFTPYASCKAYHEAVDVFQRMILVMSDYERIISMTKLDENIKCLKLLAKNADNDDVAKKNFKNAYDRVFKVVNTIDETSFIKLFCKPFKHIYVQVKGKTPLTEAIINEETLSKSDRKRLDDSDFGLPKTRSFPINDEAHILKAIQMFKNAKPSQRKELANNIAKKIIKLGLVGKIHINDDNPNKDFFPKWMLADNVEFKSDDKTYTILIDGEEYETGKLNESALFDIIL